MERERQRTGPDHLNISKITELCFMYMNKKAFTLIEVVIATAILSVIVVSIYGAFSVGIKAWHRGSEGGDFQRTRTALLKLQKELRNSFFFSSAPFKGASSELSFPLVMPGDDKDRLCVITYYVKEDENTGHKSLVRKESPFTENSEDKEEALEKELFSVTSMNFKYAYRLGDAAAGLEWRDDWLETQNNLPVAVKVSFKLDHGGEIYNKTIFIPQGALNVE